MTRSHPDDVAVPHERAGAGTLRIDLDALRRNYRRLRVAADGAEIAGVVKADAYGLGAARVAPALLAEGCRSFFVAQACEALTLADILPADATIFVLNGLRDGLESACADREIVPVLNSMEQVSRWRAEARRRARRLPAAIQLDSGMSRLGLAPEDAQALAQDATLLDTIDPVLVMSHLACADEPDHPANRQQLTAFRALARHFPPARRSLANSAGIFLSPDFRFDLARPGIALYGGAPLAGRPNPMEPVVSLMAPVVQLRDVPAGSGIGYGFSQIADRPMRLATLPVGYADGWLRHLGGRGSAVFGQHRLPFVGRVSMDSIIVDAGAAPELQPGDMVELLGANRPLEALAEEAGTISYEILTRLGSRFQRIYADSGVRP